MSSRQYVKRIWRVPKDRGATAYLAAIIVKALVKHGWPAKSEPSPYTNEAFCVVHVDGRRTEDLPDDFANAVAIATRIASRTHRLDVSEYLGVVQFNRPYIVTAGGHFREVKHDSTG